MKLPWNEMLPLPKSQPGWMAVVIFLILSMTPFAVFHDQLRNWQYQQTHVSYSNKVNPGPYELDVQVFVPKYVPMDDDYIVQIHIKNLGPGEMAVNGIILTQMRKSDDVPILTYDTFPMDETIAPGDEVEKDLTLQTAKSTQNESELGLNMQIFDARLDFPMNFTEEYLFGSVMVNNSEAKANKIIELMLTFNVGLSILFCMAIISCGVTDRREYKEIFLSDVDGAGWNAARASFIRAFPVYVTLLLIVVFSVVFSNAVRVALAVFIFAGLFYWLFKPNAAALFQSIRRKINKANEKKHSGKA